MKWIITFLTGCLLNSFCMGQSNDPEAKQILDQASAKIRSYKAVQVAFTLQLQDAQGKSQGTKK